MSSPVPIPSSDEPFGKLSSPSLAAGRWMDSVLEGFQSQHKLLQWEYDHPGQKHPYDTLSALGLVPKESNDLDEEDVYEVEQILMGVSTPSEVSSDDIERIKHLLKIRAPSTESSTEPFEDESQSKSFEGVEDQDNKALERSKHMLAVRAASVSSTETETDYDYDEAGQTANTLFGSQGKNFEQAAVHSNLVSSPVLEQRDLAEEREVREQLLAVSSPLSNFYDLADGKENTLTSGSSSALGSAQEVGGGKSKRKLSHVSSTAGEGDTEGRKKRKKTVIWIEISEDPLSVQVFRDQEDDE